MSTFADNYAPPVTISADNPTSVVGLAITGIESVESAVNVSTTFTLTPSADTTELILQLKRSVPVERFVQTLNILLPAPIVDPTTMQFTLEGQDSPGAGGDASYDVRVTCVDASGETAVQGAQIHARYNTPYQPTQNL